VTTCIGCGCTDDQACEGGCSWALESQVAPIGVCTNCTEMYGEIELSTAEAEYFADSEPDDSGLILPGDPEYDYTLRGGR
jgi:hypothetical protein